ncbi:unnamed protein product [Effrenium voratum]|nr:unnamed protein product [Effrenium voratum]
MNRLCLGAVLSLMGQCAALIPMGIVGDQVPAQYPVVDVHVAEPPESEFDVAAANEELEKEEEQLKQVEAKMDAYYKFVLAHSDSAKQRLLASVPGLPTGRGSASFLASKVMPVDGFKIRNSLFLTQLLRSPAQGARTSAEAYFAVDVAGFCNAASVNVIEKEDVANMKSKAVYKGMQDKLRRMKEQTTLLYAVVLPQVLWFVAEPCLATGWRN